VAYAATPPPAPEDRAARHPEPRAWSRVDAPEYVDAMPRRVPIIAVMGLLLGAQAPWSQSADTLPPIAGPPRDVDRFQQRLLPPNEEPSYRDQLPPPVPFAPRGDRRRADRAPPVPPSPSAQELQARVEPRNLRWRTAVEAEFGEWWSRFGCLPHPRRHEWWLDALAEWLGADTPEKAHVLYGLVMERVEVYQPPTRTRFSGLMGDAEEWVNGAVGWREPGDLFCR
jgi:hypothetical protein